MFVNGPITVGPGQIVGEKYQDLLRTHLDIQNGNSNTKYMAKATTFFESLAEKACKIDTIVEMFSKIFLLKICSLFIGSSWVIRNDIINRMDWREFNNV